MVKKTNAIKIQAIIMVKDGEESIINTMISLSQNVDVIKIFDTGSTDKTIELVEEFKKLNQTKVTLSHIPFDNFSQARNLCLEMCNNSHYQWTLFVDDSYELNCTYPLRDELKKLPSSVNCVGIKIFRHNIDYISKRLTRTSAELRYKGHIHEDIDCDIEYIVKNSYIFDRVYDTHMLRTHNRLFSDIKMLRGLTDPRSLFFRANMTFQLYHRGLANAHAVLNACYDRILIDRKYPGHPEDSYAMSMTAGLMCTILGYKKESVQNYLFAALTCKTKSGEPFFYIFLNTDNAFYLNKAYENRFLGYHIMPTTSRVYSARNSKGEIEKGEIEKCYDSYYQPIDQRI